MWGRPRLSVHLGQTGVEVTEVTVFTVFMVQYLFLGWSVCPPPLYALGTMYAGDPGWVTPVSLNTQTPSRVTSLTSSTTYSSGHGKLLCEEFDTYCHFSVVRVVPPSPHLYWMLCACHLWSIFDVYNTSCGEWCFFLGVLQNFMSLS